MTPMYFRLGGTYALRASHCAAIVGTLATAAHPIPICPDALRFSRLRIRLDVRLFHDACPLHPLRSHEVRKLLRRAAAVFGTETDQAFLYVGHFHGLDDVAIDLGDDVGGHFGGADEAVPGGCVEAGEAALGNGGQIGIRRRALRARLRDGEHFAAFHMRRHGGHGVERILNLAAHQIDQQWAAALVRHVQF